MWKLRRKAWGHYVTLIKIAVYLCISGHIPFCVSITTLLENMLEHFEELASDFQDHVTIIVYLVTWPMNEREAGVDLALIKTPLLFLSELQLIGVRTTSLT